MDQALAEPQRRSGRFWLYTPFVILILVAIAWSAAWFYIRNRAVEALDGWLAVEARAGRQWTCQDQRVGGYPFNIELSCASLNLKQGAITGTLGGFRSVAQVYQPRFIITEIDGPLQMTDGVATLRGTWDLLQSSVHGTPNGLQRASVVAENPSVTISGLGPADLTSSSQHLELHLRPSPARAQGNSQNGNSQNGSTPTGAQAGPQAGAYDVALSTRQTKIPVLDALVGGGEATDIQFDGTVTQAAGFRGRPVAEELERWRNAGGKLDVLMLSLAKGTRRVEAKGEIGLDALHRPAGQLSVSAAGLDGLLGNVVGGRAGGALLGALFGGGRQAQGQADAPRLVTLPPLFLANGKLAMGPFVIPNVTLPPLY
ncbi:DUF2125 domain-containing protein [Microvirga pudoricolor]|uniref:DUF2125 domain-containing protein n=1 Tax=Microvirga pudoricolor TaxID=2778729 RepID=UPI001951ACE7|nr:DUF2125 domain-containing protein [Microvirga pudoricolor]MBM6593435.1 DUF2125 domain-containing protein [Microvirga pudoricolor]